MFCGDLWLIGLVRKIWGCNIEQEEEEKGDVKENSAFPGLASRGTENGHSQEACREDVKGLVTEN